jgi:hypothetical protein
MYSEGIGTEKNIDKALEYNALLRGNGNYNVDMRSLRLLSQKNSQKQ